MSDLDLSGDSAADALRNLRGYLADLDGFYGDELDSVVDDVIDRPTGHHSDLHPLRLSDLRAVAALDLPALLEAEWEKAAQIVEDECPHEADEHAEGTCEVCDYAFALAARLHDVEPAPGEEAVR